MFFVGHSSSGFRDLRINKHTHTQAYIHAYKETTQTVHRNQWHNHYKEKKKHSDNTNLRPDVCLIPLALQCCHMANYCENGKKNRGKIGERVSDRHQNLTDWSLGNAHPSKNSLESVHNFLNNVFNKQTNRLINRHR